MTEADFYQVYLCRNFAKPNNVYRQTVCASSFEYHAYFGL